MNESIWSLISDALTANPEQTAWICRLGRGKSRDVSYDQIYRSALNIAADLRERGIGPGNKVGLMAPNGPEWTAAALRMRTMAAKPVTVRFLLRRMRRLW